MFFFSLSMGGSFLSWNNCNNSGKKKERKQGGGNGGSAKESKIYKNLGVLKKWKNKEKKKLGALKKQKKQKEGCKVESRNTHEAFFPLGACFGLRVEMHTWLCILPIPISPPFL